MEPEPSLIFSSGSTQKEFLLVLQSCSPSPAALGSGSELWTQIRMETFVVKHFLFSVSWWGPLWTWSLCRTPWGPPSCPSSWTTVPSPPGTRPIPVFSTIAENFAIATNGIENREIKKRDTGIYRNVLNSHICSNKKLQKKCIYFKKTVKKSEKKNQEPCKQFHF